MTVDVYCANLPLLKKLLQANRSGCYSDQSMKTNLNYFVVTILQVSTLLLATVCFWQLYLWWLPEPAEPYGSGVYFPKLQPLPPLTMPAGLATNFGREDESVQMATSAQQRFNPVTKTINIADLNIVVEGIVVMSEASHARAILSVQGKPSQVYRIGDELQKQMTLVEINAKSLVVVHDSETIELLFATTKTTQPNNIASVNQEATSVSNNDPNPSNSAILIEGELRDALVKNPMQATQYILAAPDFRNGKMHGYRLRPGRETKMFEASGLKEGDVLTHIGENHVSQITAGSLLGGGMLSQSIIPITLERQGRVMSLDIQIQ